ncbi:hypothetical protein Misp03_35990 [Microbispora sp. NBRC 16548]|nr:hypothetical protein Misp03_35990 [Microbispora sp. NBRC 16548]
MVTAKGRSGEGLGVVRHLQLCPLVTVTGMTPEARVPPLVPNQLIVMVAARP